MGKIDALNAVIDGHIRPNGQKEITGQIMNRVLHEMANYTESVEQDVVKKVDAVPGKGLSTEDFTTAEKKKLQSLENYDDKEIIKEIVDLAENKVDKEEGKGLSTEDFTSEEKEKLAGLENYNDEGIREALNKKQDAIADLETIRKGAQKGATALQEHQDISHLATKQEVEDIFPMKMVTYADLVAMRDEGRLVPGQQYRIIDFVTTVCQANAKSARHQFDVIVTADGPSVLNEKARAAISEGDTYFTEAGANLKAWQLWYSLDNDKSRFEWADVTNGKGVIYRMIDEWQNDVPYDFKNVVYNVKSVINAKKAMYGGQFSCVLTYQGPTTLEGIDYYRWQVTQISGPSDSSLYYTTDETPTIDTIFYSVSGDELINNNDILFESFVQGYAQYTFGEKGEYGSDDIVDGTMSRLSRCYSNIMEVYEVSRQYIIANLPFNTFGTGCNCNTLGRDCCVNTFGSNCSNNTFGSNCHHNTLGDKCSSNTFGNNAHENELFEMSQYITLKQNSSIKINGMYCTFDSGVSNVTCINLDGELESVSHIRFIGNIQGLTMRQVSEVALANVIVLGPINNKSADLSGRVSPSIIYQSSEGKIVHTSLMFE